jgi:hypothetical protein
MYIVSHAFFMEKMEQNPKSMQKCSLPFHGVGLLFFNQSGLTLGLIYKILLIVRSNKK